MSSLGLHFPPDFRAFLPQRHPRRPYFCQLGHPVPQPGGPQDRRRSAAVAASGRPKPPAPRAACPAGRLPLLPRPRSSLSLFPYSAPTAKAQTSPHQNPVKLRHPTALSHRTFSLSFRKSSVPPPASPLSILGDHSQPGNHPFSAKGQPLPFSHSLRLEKSFPYQNIPQDLFSLPAHLALAICALFEWSHLSQKPPSPLPADCPPLPVALKTTLISPLHLRNPVPKCPTKAPLPTTHPSHPGGVS